MVGQAPGARVNASGVPFSDPSGDRLRDWMGVTPAEFYDARRIAIVPMGFCFPGLDATGGDLPPRSECAPLWRARLFALLPDIELMLLIGAHAQRWHLGKDLLRPSLTSTVATWDDILARTHRPRCLPLPHPSWRNSGWLRANPWYAREVLPRLKSEVSRVIER